jgi:hypothetical protein
MSEHETDNLTKSYRYELTKLEKDLLDYIVNDFHKQHPDIVGIDNLMSHLNNPIKIKYSVKKTDAAEKATEARTKKAKAKIQNAINILNLENRKITHYSIAQEAKVSYNTVKKYITLNEMN